MEQLDKFNSIKQEIFDYFGYVEDWVKIPLDDAREYYWKLDENEHGGGQVAYAETQTDLEDEDEGNYYENSIYAQRFLKKWVYRGKDFTMICVNTHTDGNKFLQIFDNNKEM